MIPVAERAGGHGAPARARRAQRTKLGGARRCRGGVRRPARDACASTRRRASPPRRWRRCRAAPARCVDVPRWAASGNDATNRRCVREIGNDVPLRDDFAMHQIQVASLVRQPTNRVTGYLRTIARQRLIASANESRRWWRPPDKQVRLELEDRPCRATETGAGYSYGLEADDISPPPPRRMRANDQEFVLLDRGEYALEQKSVWNALGIRGT